MSILVLLALGGLSFIATLFGLSALMLAFHLRRGDEAKGDVELEETQTPAYAAKTVPVSGRAKTLPVLGWALESAPKDRDKRGSSKGAGWLS